MFGNTRKQYTKNYAVMM